MPLNERTGWIVALWGWCVAVMPSATTVLVYLSIVVAVLQILILSRKVFKDAYSKPKALQEVQTTNTK
jgi:high-affinity Fe2+/Pb2+ permease